MMERNKSGRYGIHMKKYCAAHTAFIESRLSEGGRPDALLRLHERKLLWLQHERLIHLLVTLLVSLVFLFSIWLFIALENSFVLLLTAVVLALLAAYIRHYFFLENTVQRWYTLCDQITEKLEQ